MIPVTEQEAALFYIKAVDENGTIYTSSYPQYPELATKDVLLIGFDQSTSQTGVAIKNKQGNLLMAIDFVNTGSLPHPLYEQMMQIMLKKILKGHKVEMVVIEKPFKAKGKGSYEVLVKLKGFMETLMYTIPEFRQAKLGEIFPQTWRKTYLADKRYTGRKKASRDLKECAREEAILRYPHFEMYANMTSTPPDSCDAIGVLDGYYENNFVEGVQKINTTMDINYAIKFDHMIVLLEPGTTKEFFKKNLPQIGWYRGVKDAMYNPDLSFENNCRRAVTDTNSIVCLAISDVPTMSIMMWESNIAYEVGKIYYVIAWRKHVDEKLGVNSDLNTLGEWGLTIDDINKR